MHICHIGSTFNTKPPLDEGKENSFLLHNHNHSLTNMLKHIQHLSGSPLTASTKSQFFKHTIFPPRERERGT